MKPVPGNIKEIIDELADNTKPLLYTDIADLSNISNDELKYLDQLWPKIEVDRRRKITTRLVDLAEDNFELNFDSILKNRLRDPDPEVRAKAIEGLWENEETILITYFIRMLNEDPSDVVQAAAAKALGKYALLAELKKLGAYSSERVAQALLAILTDKKKPEEVRRRALEAAAPFSLAQVKEAIKEAYVSPVAKVKNSALFAMGKNCDSVWLPILIKEMTSPDSETRFEAAGACGEICDEEAVPHLIKLSQDKDAEVQQAAIIALGKIGGSKARLFLQKCVKSQDEIISEAAEQALQQIDAEGETLF